MTVLAALAGQRDRLVDELAALVTCESPSSDSAATEACGKVLVEIAADRVDLPVERIDSGGRTHLRWGGPAPRVLLLGHVDTVWPTGTADRWPFTVGGDRASGPGCFDMKAGLVQLFAALSTLDDVTGVGVLVTSDEEIGSTTSQALIEETARTAHAVLVCEPSADGALKVARKGVASYRVGVTGRAAHAGLEPERGINAVTEVAAQIMAIAGLGSAADGTTVTPTTVSGGTTVNTVPAHASLAVDVRAMTVAELERVDRSIRSLTPIATDAALEVTLDCRRPPLERARAERLLGLARTTAGALGLPAIDAVEVGGGSDGNFTGALGVDTLDGLGAVGGGAHAEGEWVSITGMVERAAVLAAVVEHLVKERAT